MDEARAVLARLDRIDALDRVGAAPEQLLRELRALVHEAERWARREDHCGALEAAAECRQALEEAGRGLSPSPTKAWSTYST
jgi:hypothetical protein